MRHYLAMILAFDDMVGQVLDYLDERGLTENTLVVLTSDHGQQGGAHGYRAVKKKMPYEESIHIPLIVRLPGMFQKGIQHDTLTAPVDFFPTLCSLCGVPIPRTVEGYDLSEAWRGKSGSFEQEAVLTMNFTGYYDHCCDGNEWRGVRTKQYSYAQWLDGRIELFDIQKDPLQLNNLAGNASARETETCLQQHLRSLMQKRHDHLHPGSYYRAWYDKYRRIIHSAFGPLGNPDNQPDCSLLE